MKKKKFSEYYNYNYSIKKDTWFNPVVEWDSKLFIDPLLLKRCQLEDFKDSYENLMNFFINACVKMKKNGISKKIIQNMLSFDEVEEAHLGYSYNSNKGSGFKGKTAIEFFERYDTLVNKKIINYDELEEITLFEENVDLDRISDMVLSIIKRDFINYSLKIAKNENFPTTTFNLTTYFDFEEMRWVNESVKLPYVVNNLGCEVPVLLIPNCLLVQKLHFNSEDFIDWLWNNKSEYVKETFEYNIKKDLEKNKSNIINKIIEDNQEDIFRQYGNVNVYPYDLEKDSDSIMKIYDFVNKFSAMNISQEKSVMEMTELLIEDLQHAVINERGWTLLLADNSIKFIAEPKISKFTHLLFERKTEGLNLNLDISPETNKGRGPVDFKLSRGREKVLIEIKTSTHPDLMTCVDDNKQLHQYMKQERCNDAILLVFINKVEDYKKINELNKKVMESNQRNNHNMMIKTIECIPAPSASKL